jgi:hypothetical protein
MKTFYYIIIQLEAVKLPSQTKNKATKEKIPGGHSFNFLNVSINKKPFFIS